MSQRISSFWGDLWDANPTQGAVARPALLKLKEDPQPEKEQAVHVYALSKAADADMPLLQTTHRLQRSL
eukprot:scaffold350040_cov47-Prasinocladus_malaysianus.AAC.1